MSILIHGKKQSQVGHPKQALELIKSKLLVTVLILVTLLNATGTAVQSRRTSTCTGYELEYA
eukprot:scaffold454125_cov18-Prasinocladus_malaysianus.AAC.1